MTVGKTETGDEEDDTTNDNTDVCRIVGVRRIEESSSRLAQVCTRGLGGGIGQSK